MAKVLLLVLIVSITSIVAVFDDSGLTLNNAVTSGADMAGATVTVRFPTPTNVNGVPSLMETLTWQAFPQRGPDSGGVESPNGWSLIFDYPSTFPSSNMLQQGMSLSELAPWYFTTTIPITLIEIDLRPVAAWDRFSLISDPTSPNTPNSGDGASFFVYSITSPFGANALYSQPATFPGAQMDVQYIMTILFTNANAGFIGNLSFSADTDTLTPIVPLSCGHIEFIEDLEVNYIPHLAINDTSLPPIYTNPSTGIRMVHLELHSLAALNRRTGVSGDATTIFFKNELPGCITGIDYQWTFRRASDDDGNCIDIYTLDIPFDLLSSFTCGLNSETSVTGTVQIYGVIEITTTTQRNVTRQSGVTLVTDSKEHSEEGFLISIDTTATAVSTDVRVYSAVEVTAVIYEYDVPTADTDKCFFIETTVQDPQSEGFRLVFTGLERIHDGNLPGVELPAPEDPNAITAFFTELTTGCRLENATSSSGTTVQLCVQHWKLQVLINDPTVCQFNALKYRVSARIICNNPNTLYCPLTNSTDQTSYVVDISTDEFCPTVIANYSFSGSVQTYYSDFSAPHIGFFEGETVGFLVTILDTTGTNLQTTITDVTLTYVGAVLGAGITDQDVFLPGILAHINDNTGAVIIGPPSPDFLPVATDVQLVPNACGSGNFACANNQLKFTFVLDPAVFPIEADQFENLKVGVTVELTLSSGVKKSLERVFEINSMNTINNVLITGSKSGASSLSPLFIVLSIIVTIVTLLNKH